MLPRKFVLPIDGTGTMAWDGGNGLDEGLSENDWLSEIGWISANAANLEGCDWFRLAQKKRINRKILMDSMDWNLRGYSVLANQMYTISMNRTQPNLAGLRWPARFCQRCRRHLQNRTFQPVNTITTSIWTSKTFGSKLPMQLYGGLLSRGSGSCRPIALEM